MFLKTKIFSYHIQHHLILDIFAFTMKLKEYCFKYPHSFFCQKKASMSTRSISLPSLTPHNNFKSIDN